MMRASAGLITSSAGGTDLSRIFSEEPVPLDIFVRDKKYLGNPPLSDVQYEAVRYTERIYYPELYPLMAKEFNDTYWTDITRMVNFVTLQWGKGSGKDHICRIASMRIAYLLMCLISPQEYYGIPEQDTIHMLNVASSSTQAQQAFFTPITRAVKSGWFKDRCDPHINTISYAKNIECISGHSDAETQEGLNLMLGIADEVDAFKSKGEIVVRRIRSAREPTKSVENILDMIRTSGSTRFPQVFKNVRISYPRYLGSMIQQLTRTAREDLKKKGEASRHFLSGPLATWEVNPRVTGKDMFADDYETDPVMARSKYECKPSRAVNPYFRNHDAVDATFLDVPPPVKVSYKREHKAWVPFYAYRPDFKPIVGAVYAMHADMAISGDKAGIALAHVQKYETYEKILAGPEGEDVPFLDRRPVIKVDFVLAFEADISLKPAREIQIRWARQLAFELVQRGFTIKQMTYDGFQSEDSMQILRSRGIDSKKVSTDANIEPYRNLRDIMYEGRLATPKNTLLREELLSLTKLVNGKIDHPASSSKDLADAFACAAQGAVEVGGEEDPQQREAFFGNASFEVGPAIGSLAGVPRDMEGGSPLQGSEHMRWQQFLGPS
jgi:hypothetical protein